VRKTYESNTTIFLSFSPHRCEFIEAIEEGSRHLLVRAIRIIDPRSNGVFFLMMWPLSLNVLQPLYRYRNL
jgi:hypothetical protein